MVKHLKDENLSDLIKTGIVLVDFYAEWCGPCKMLSPILEKLDESVIKVDTDIHQDLAIKNGVMSVPTVFIYKFIGFRSEDEIKQIISKIK